MNIMEIFYRQETLTALIFILTFFITYLFQKQRKRNLIPGPYCVPFIGYLGFFFTKAPHEFLAKLRNKYGNIIGFYIGQHHITVLNDAASIKEIMNKETLLARPSIPPVSAFEKNSIVNSTGKIFKHEKLFTLRVLRSLGYGKRKLETEIQKEISYFLSRIKHYDGKEFDIRVCLKPSINNNISSLLFGKRYDYDDPVALKLIDGIDLFEKNNSQIDVSVFFPFLKFVQRLFGVNIETRCQIWSNMLGNIIKKEIEEHKKTLDENNIRDYLDGYLLEIENDSENNTFSESALLGTARAFFIGGNTTTQSTIEWFLLAMATHPHIQSRAQQEIDEVIGKYNTIQLSDQLKLPYLRSVVTEIYRWRTLGPLSLIRCSLENVRTSNGYIIPKDSLVFSNLWAVHNDPDNWTKPEEFQPERFLDKDGKFVSNENCIPFSIGKRSCPGENLAHLEVFLYSARLLQEYNICPPENEELDLIGNIQLTNVPKAFKIIFRSRN